MIAVRPVVTFSLINISIGNSPKNRLILNVPLWLYQHRLIIGNPWSSIRTYGAIWYLQVNRLQPGKTSILTTQDGMWENQGSVTVMTMTIQLSVLHSVYIFQKEFEVVDKAAWFESNPGKDHKLNE